MKRWYFLAGIAVSILFLYLALRGLNLPQVWETIRSANLIWLVPAVLVYFVGVVFRTWRWQILLRPSCDINIRDVFPIDSIGYMGNNIYPARAGELLRVILMKHHYQMPISTTLATILVERIFDGVVMLGFIIFNLGELRGLSSSSGFISSVQSLAYWGAVAFISALAVFVLAALFPVKVEKALVSIINGMMPSRWRESTASIIGRFMGGLATLRTPRETLVVVINSAAVWLLETLTYWFVMRAFPFEVSLFVLMLMTGIVNLTTILPSAPGYIGTFDAPGIALLTYFGVLPAVAAGYMLILHATLWLPITLVGGYFFAREGLDWSRELEKAKAERKAVK